LNGKGVVKLKPHVLVPTLVIVLVLLQAVGKLGRLFGELDERDFDRCCGCGRHALGILVEFREAVEDELGDVFGDEAGLYIVICSIANN
jgi:methylase of polypeptide subunit release factors